MTTYSFFDFMKGFPDKWDWKFLSSYDNLSVDFVARFPQEPWDWMVLTKRFSLEDIKKYPELPWDFTLASTHELPISFLQEEPEETITTPTFELVNGSVLKGQFESKPLDCMPIFHNAHIRQWERQTDLKLRETDCAFQQCPNKARLVPKFHVKGFDAAIFLMPVCMECGRDPSLEWTNPTKVTRIMCLSKRTALRSLGLTAREKVQRYLDDVKRGVWKLGSTVPVRVVLRKNQNNFRPYLVIRELVKDFHEWEDAGDSEAIEEDEFIAVLREWFPRQIKPIETSDECVLGFMIGDTSKGVLEDILKRCL